MDSAYLKSAVGAPLTEGLAAVAVEQPDDPVEFLGHWLLKYLSRKRVDEATVTVSSQALKEEKAANEAAEKEVANKETQEKEKSSRVSAILESAKVKNMWANTINVVLENTSATNAYISMFEPPPPQRDEEGNEIPPEPEEEEQLAEEEQPPPPEEEEQPEPELDEEGNPVLDEEGNPVMKKKEPAPPKEKPLPKIPKRNVLRYIAANDHQDWLLNKRINRKQAPATFSAIDARGSCLVKNVFDSEFAIHFHGMPMPGSYLAAAFVDVEKAILGAIHADTVGGIGDERLTQADEKFINECVSALCQTYDRLVTQVAVRKARETQEVISLWEESVKPNLEEAESQDVEGMLAVVQQASESHLAAAKKAIEDKITPDLLRATLYPDEDEPLQGVALRIIAAAISILRGTKEAPLHDVGMENDALKAAATLGDTASFVASAVSFDVSAMRVKKSFIFAKRVLGLLPPDAAAANPAGGEGGEGEEGGEEGGHGGEGEGGAGGAAATHFPLITLAMATDAGYVASLLFVYLSVLLPISDLHLAAKTKEAAGEERAEGEQPPLLELDLEEEERREEEKRQREEAIRRAEEEAAAAAAAEAAGEGGEGEAGEGEENGEAAAE